MLVFARFKWRLVIHKNSSNEEIGFTFIRKVDGSQSLSSQVVGHKVQIATVQWKWPCVLQNFFASYNVVNGFYFHTRFFVTTFLYIFPDIPCLQCISAEIRKVHFLSSSNERMHVLRELADKSNILRKVFIWVFQYLHWYLVQVISSQGTIIEVFGVRGYYDISHICVGFDEEIAGCHPCATCLELHWLCITRNRSPCLLGDLVYKLRRVKGEANFISSGSKIVKRLRRRQYDPAIIERTNGLVLGPFTALYRSFLKRCTLTNKAVGTIWRVLSKPHQRRQGPDPRPLWLLVGTPSAFGPELAHRLRVAQPTLMDFTRYFWYTFILLYMFVYFYDLSTLAGCWSSVYIRRIIYKIF